MIVVVMSNDLILFIYFLTYGVFYSVLPKVLRATVYEVLTLTLSDLKLHLLIMIALGP